MWKFLEHDPLSMYTKLEGPSINFIRTYEKINNYKIKFLFSHSMAFI